MYVVAIAALSAPLEDEAPRLAGDLGLTAYEARLLLTRGVPAVVLRTPDKARAVELLRRLRERGHQAVAFDASAALARKSMLRGRALEFGSDTLTADCGALPYAGILALIRGSQPTRTETTHTTTSRKLDLTGAVVTGGLKLTKKVKQEHRIVAEDREQMLFVFPRAGTPAWLLEEHHLHYQCLGPDMVHNRMENFARVIGKLRQLAPDAVYDDSLVSFSKAGHDKLGEQAIDEQAHLLALCAAKGLLAR